MREQTYDPGSQARMSELFVHVTSLGHLIQTTVGPGDSGVAHCMSAETDQNGQPRVIFRASEAGGVWFIHTQSFRKFRVPDGQLIGTVCERLLQAENEDNSELPEWERCELGLTEISYEDYVAAFARWLLPDDLELIHKGLSRFIKSFGRMPASIDELRTTRRWPGSVVFPAGWDVHLSGTAEAWTLTVRHAVPGQLFAIDQSGLVTCRDAG